ncbi:MAG: hypothetical protein AAB388_02085 [Patescibacteria group bacterium]
MGTFEDTPNQAEQVAIPKNRAAKLLTRIAALLLPDSFFDSKVIGERDESDPREFEVPDPDDFPADELDLAHEQEVIDFLDKIEKLGMVRTRSADEFVKTEQGNLVYNRLLVPWEETGRGAIDVTFDARKLKRLINRLADDSKKERALQYFEELQKIIEVEEVESPLRYIENLPEPSFESLAGLEKYVTQFDEETIARVNAITDAKSALNDPDRIRMKNSHADVYESVRQLLTSTKIYLDKNRENYPEFWLNFEKFKLINDAIGIIGKDGVRHKMSF